MVVDSEIPDPDLVSDGACGAGQWSRVWLLWREKGGKDSRDTGTSPMEEALSSSLLSLTGDKGCFFSGTSMLCDGGVLYNGVPDTCTTSQASPVLP